MLGYNQDMRADGIFTFTEYSHFGNGNIASKPPMYYCGFTTPPSAEEDCLGINAVFDSTSIPYSSAPKTTLPVT
jgi:hypothetical protein